MTNYPYYRFPAAANPYGYPQGGAGQMPGPMPGQMPGQVPQLPAGSVIPGPTGFGSPGFGGGTTAPGGAGAGMDAGGPGQLPLEQSYIENILRLNLGKIGTFYMTYENNREWNAKIFRGRIEAAGRDHIIISDTQTGMRFLLLMVNLDYVTFDEELNYFYQGIVGAGTGGGPAPATR